jgi:hypothetical protein
MDIQTSPDPVARARDLGAEIDAAADEIEYRGASPRRCWSDCMGSNADSWVVKQSQAV